MKDLGFTNVKIYNGGIKDWKKSGFTLVSNKPLPEAKVEFVTTQYLYEKISQASGNDCGTGSGEPLVTIVDFRNENHLANEHALPQIDTNCPQLQLLLDDLLNEEMRKKIPKKGEVISITETGNRDEYVIRYLSQFEYSNVKGLKFGMRGWLKHRYPIK